MPNRLLLKINSEQNNEQVEFILIIDGRLNPAKITPLNELSTYPKNHEIIVLTPGTDTLLMHSTVPKASYSQLQKAIPYSLEEELITDVEDLHFAFIKDIETHSYAVAVTEKKLLSSWLSLLEQAHIKPSTIIPEYLTLPIKEASWTVLITEHFALVRMGLNSGFTIEKEYLFEMLSQPFQQMVNSNKLQYIKVINLSATEFEIPESCIIPKELFQIESTQENLLTVLALGIITSPTQINLLQGEFQVNVQLTKTKKLWLTTAMLAASLIILFLLGNVISYFYLNYQSNKQQAQIAELYFQAFPNASSVVSPKIRIQEELTKFQSRANDNGLLLLLSKMGPILNSSKSINIKNLAYQNNKLTFVIQTNNFQTLQKFISELTATGLQAQQTNATTNKNGVTAELSLSTVAT